MTYLTIIYQFATSLVLIFSFYFVLYMPFSLKRARRINMENHTMCRFAVLIPARNEEGNIERTINSLKEIDYPLDLLKIYFILDNSDDSTKDIILNNSVKNVVCCEKKDKICGKARALNWFLKEYRDEIKVFDAITVFDADNHIDDKFFNKLSARLSRGEKIIQGNTMALKVEGNASSIINYVTIEVVNFLREQCKSNAGLSCRLRGHGMCFTTDLLDEIVFDTESITEDFQLTIDLIMKGFKVIWAPECIVYSRFPEKVQNLTKQRLRWTRGRVDTYKKNISKILRRLFEKINWINLDLFFELSLPPLSVTTNIYKFNHRCNLDAVGQVCTFLSFRCLSANSYNYLQLFRN